MRTPDASSMPVTLAWKVAAAVTSGGPPRLIPVATGEGRGGGTVLAPPPPLLPVEGAPLIAAARWTLCAGRMGRGDAPTPVPRLFRGHHTLLVKSSKTRGKWTVMHRMSTPASGRKTLFWVTSNSFCRRPLLPPPPNESCRVTVLTDSPSEDAMDWLNDCFPPASWSPTTPDSVSELRRFAVAPRGVRAAPAGVACDPLLLCSFSSGRKPESPTRCKEARIAELALPVLRAVIRSPILPIIVLILWLPSVGPAAGDMRGDIATSHVYRPKRLSQFSHAKEYMAIACSPGLRFTTKQYLPCGCG